MAGNAYFGRYRRMMRAERSVPLAKWVIQCVCAGATLLAVIAAAVAYYQMPVEQRDALWHNVGRVIVWAGIVLTLPWATFFVTTAVARRESNAAGAALVAGYTVLDALVLLLLVGLPVGTFLACAAAFGVLLALTYNLLTCDWVAERGA